MDSMEICELYTPSLEDIAEVLQKGLEYEFEHVQVSVLECPDLTEWGLAFEGLCGSERLVDVGGTPFLMDPRYHKTCFDLNDIAKAVGMPENACFLGAASGDANFIGVNSELMPNSCLGKKNETRVALMRPDGKGKPFSLKPYDSDKVGFLANLFACDGVNGDVLKIRVGIRKGRKDFVSSIQSVLKSQYGENPIGCGGVFKIVEGQFKAHIMPDFKSTFMQEGPEVEEWLEFFEFGKGSTFLSTFVTCDPSNLNLRLQHTHFFNALTGEGGHYHHDTTPENVIYEGYFNTAKRVYRYCDAFKYVAEQ